MIKTGLGLTGLVLGGTLGTFLCPGLGTAAGGMIGAGLAGGIPLLLSAEVISEKRLKDARKKGEIE